MFWASVKSACRGGASNEFLILFEKRDLYYRLVLLNSFHT